MAWRGSFIAPLYKGKGTATECGNHRDVWIESLDAKDFHAYLRTHFFPLITACSRGTQCGGIDSRGADIAQHLVRAIWDYAKATS
eukprot:8239404-Lingulodinium_polyedra.AAC.1